MTELLKKGALYLMSEKCYDNYFLEHNFFDVPCFKALLSKGLGIGIIAGSMLVKVPQVLKIFKNKSGAGINMLGVLLDLTAITMHMSYCYRNAYPFSSWGDNSFLALQTAAIAAMVWFYNGALLRSVSFVALYTSLVYCLCSEVVPLHVLTTAQSLNIPILLLGKLSQAYTNYKNGSTGQLSAVTVLLLFAGSLARIFTSIQETGDTMIITTFCFSTFANGVITAQLLYYWNKPAKDEQAKSVAAAKKAKSKKAE